MILIGTSGSTKCDWQLIKEKKPFLKVSSKGINPFFHNDTTISKHISSIKELQDHIEDIDVVFFYGAGCSNKGLKNIINRGLSSVFKRSNLYINHDIVAAAFATYEGVPNITGLIGTGANSCSFDGDIVRQEITGIDYILGGEGSGAYLGKKLIKDYLYHKLPEEIKIDFETNFNLNRDSLLENVYKKPDANVFLASFVPFIQERQKHSYLRSMIKESLTKYMDLYICSFRNYSKIKTHFVGSIPYFFKNILAEVAKEKDIILGNIIKEPIEPLVEYHINKYYKL
ncbi:MAG: hypothetical protein OEX22_10425 [Cyclobacteriaceae bacterium]|nr:hypothetical protein [Cyclobacteriaceae bacterium]